MKRNKNRGENKYKRAHMSFTLNLCLSWHSEENAECIIFIATKGVKCNMLTW
eukprot:jgi/Antlo1/1536/1296